MHLTAMVCHALQSSILDTFRELGQLLALRSVCSAWNQVIREGVWQQVALMRVSPLQRRPSCCQGCSGHASTALA